MFPLVAAALIGGAATYLVCRVLQSRTAIPGDRIAREFHRYYYMHAQATWANTEWLGVQTLKCPLDAWIYQEVIHDTRPDVIVETGTFNGGSAFYFCSLFDLIGKGRVVSIDVEHRSDRPTHERLEYVRGSSTDNAILERVKGSIQPGERVMVVLDSDHSRDHVLEELRAYWELVTPGCYLVVEDGNIHGHPVPIYDQGDPTAALAVFLEENDRFVVDRSREKHFVTFNPGGWLKRTEAAGDLREA